VYDVNADDVIEIVEQLLPPAALLAFARFQTALETSPWSVAPSINPAQENAPVRLHLLRSDGGSALVTYLIREREQLVDLLQIQWLG
jgi:hypothetical protein